MPERRALEVGTWLCSVRTKRAFLGRLFPILQRRTNTLQRGKEEAGVLRPREAKCSLHDRNKCIIVCTICPSQPTRLETRTLLQLRGPRRTQMCRRQCIDKYARKQSNAETATRRHSNNAHLLDGVLSPPCDALTSGSCLPAFTHLEDAYDRSRRTAAATFPCACAKIGLRVHSCILDGARPTGAATAVALCPYSPPPASAEGQSQD